MFKMNLMVGVSSLALILAMGNGGAKADQTIDVNDAAANAGAVQDVSDNNIRYLLQSVRIYGLEEVSDV